MLANEAAQERACDAARAQMRRAAGECSAAQRTSGRWDARHGHHARVPLASLLLLQRARECHVRVLLLSVRGRVAVRRAGGDGAVDVSAARDESVCA
jgi:hypothetical protein